MASEWRGRLPASGEIGCSLERVVVLDVETTGLRRSDRIIELACAVLGDEGEIVERYTTLVDPGRDPGPTRLHGITTTMLAGAPRFREVAADVERLLRDRVVVAHHLSFDWWFLRAELGRAGVDAPAVARGICTAQLARLVHGGSARLKHVCHRLGIDYAEAHSAAGDVRAAAGVLRALRPHLDQLPTFRPCLPFGGAWRLPRPVPPVPRPHVVEEATS